MTQLPVVAKKVFYPCKKCETDRYQVVLAHSTATTARLECEVCKTKNTFQLVEPKLARAKAGAAKKPPSKRATGVRAAAHTARWTELREKNGSNVSPYNMRNAFEVGATVEHPKFGLGFVVQQTGQSIQVIFEDAERSLVHNRG